MIGAFVRSFVDSYATLAAHSEGGAVRECDGLFAFVTGHPVSLFNGCIVVEPTSPERLQSELEWVRRHDVPYRVWIPTELDAALGAVPLRLGLEGEPPYPGMALHPVPESPQPPASVSVTQVEPAKLGEFVAVAIERGLPPALASRIYTSSFAADPDVRLFAGSLEGRPVGTSIAIRSGDVSGVYDVGTHSTARRRGVGTALTWAAIEAGVAWGCDTVVLQSTAMARSMYRAMGFRTVIEHASYVAAP